MESLSWDGAGGADPGTDEARSLPRAGLNRETEVSAATGWPGPRPIPSTHPHELAAVLRAGGVRGRLIGSAVSGGSARDLDLVVDLDAPNLACLARTLEEIAVGDWPRALNWVARLDGGGVVHLTTTLGRLDLHRPAVEPPGASGPERGADR